MQEIHIKISHKKQVCQYCRGTGLEREEARQIRERKLPLTEKEIETLICRKMKYGCYSTDYINGVNFKITQNDLINVIKNRGLLVPCISCAGKGEILI